jgi:hypothetical protein
MNTHFTSQTLTLTNPIPSWPPPTLALLPSPRGRRPSPHLLPSQRSGEASSRPCLSARLAPSLPSPRGGMAAPGLLPPTRGGGGALASFRPHAAAASGLHSPTRDGEAGSHPFPPSTRMAVGLPSQRGRRLACFRSCDGAAQPRPASPPRAWHDGGGGGLLSPRLRGLIRPAWANRPDRLAQHG